MNAEEEAAIRRAREVLGPVQVTPEVALRNLRSLRCFCLWCLAGLEVGVIFGRLGLRGQLSEALTWSAVGGRILFLSVAMMATVRLHQWKNVTVRQ